MKLTGRLVCPECSEPIMGSVDLVPGVALMTVEPDGTADYDGDTDVDWDGQFNQSTEPGKLLVQCREGHTWLVDFTEGA